MELLIVGGFLLIAGIFLLLVRHGKPKREFPLQSLDIQYVPQPSATPAPLTPKIATLSTLLPEQFIVLDLETTGLDPIRHEIIEFGAVRVNLTSDNFACFQALVKPERRVPKRISEITGITQAMVDNEGIPLKDALTQFTEFIGNLPLVTFNADFDMGFLYSAAQKHGLLISNRYTCALKRARRAWPGLPSYRLADVQYQEMLYRLLSGHSLQFRIE